MPLTSAELNYLIWRYFQETGYDLSAFTFDRQSQCSKYEHQENEDIINRIEPGCLVDLVQKGILYTIAESDAKDDSDYTLLGALVQQEITNLSDSNFSKTKNNKRFQLKSEAEENGNRKEDEMDIDNGVAYNVNTETKELSTELHFSSSLSCDWHPTSEVLAYGKSNGSVIINAIGDGKFVESVEVSHPDLLNAKNEINIVSWSPLGNLLLTAGAFSEIRAWSPDGKLRNIANTVFEDISAESEIKQSLITNILWSKSGKFVITIDSANNTTVWDGVTLSLIRQIQTEESNDVATTNATIDANGDAVQTACWLSEDKFALTTATQGIKIYDITQPYVGVNSYEVRAIGSLPGHQNHISLMKLNEFSKLLVTCSDFDYEIKVWTSSAAHTSLDLNVKTERNQALKLHASPIIGLHWIPDTDRSILASLSMEGILNMWDAETGDNLKSSELFKNAENFSPEVRHNVSKDVLLFNSVLSPNGKLLAVGDDFGKVSIWDVNVKSHKGEDKSFVRCVAIYTPSIPPEGETKESAIGLSDLRWDHGSKTLAASYIGIESVIINV
ncbi:hypothetical protein KGF57_000999 [Candida theae]|uniref:LisH domain-containing protein n=1 Tax=Candida theae TaxID=1198502 RepID=A0AAD5G043_9ASCO|nr:uncharacterized protein KGF57_000999 [Candida theae]KAI5964507.1 hypothetical protein KGF57_000999 [Candida theae]